MTDQAREEDQKDPSDLSSRSGAQGMHARRKERGPGKGPQRGKTKKAHTAVAHDNISWLKKVHELKR